MASPRRIFIATLFGVISGFICWGFAASSGPVTWYLAVATILSRTLIGFAIGISAWRMNWVFHGLILGAIFSLPMAFQGFFVPGKELFIFTGSIVMGMVYGVLIELFTSIVFRAKQ